MQTALFTNFSEEKFTGHWDGKPHVFSPGQSKYLPEYLARHFAKHLTNRELLKIGKERSTSPKKPEDVPEFMEVFNKAFTASEEKDDGIDSPDTEGQIALAEKKEENKRRTTEPSIELPDTDSFENKPVDNTPTDESNEK